MESSVRRISSIKTLLIILFTLLVVGLGVAVYFLLSNGTASSPEASYIIDDFLIADGVSINGIELGGMTYDEAKAAVDADVQRRLDELELSLVFDTDLVKLSANDLGVTCDAEEALHTAMEYGREGGYYERVTAMETARSGGMALETVFEYDGDISRSLLEDAVAEYSVEPTNASVEFDPDADDMFTYTPGKNGYGIEVEALVDLVEESVRAQDFEPIIVPLNTIEPEISVDDLKANAELVGTFTTSKLGNDNREYNIKKIAGIINGTVIQPGEVWSINDTTGPRYTDTGWKDAPAISGGRFVDEPGGGVCQVSTTLYNAAIRAEIEIAERTPHSIPSTYVDTGLDATITTGGQDLKLKNNTDYPIYIRAYTTGDTITCEVYCRPLDGYTLDFTSEVTGEIPQPETEYIEAEETPDDNPIPLGTQVIWREGRTGKTAVVTKIWKYDDGTTKEEQFGGINRYNARSEQIYQNTGNGLYPIGSTTENPDADVVDIGDINAIPDTPINAPTE